MSSFNVGPYLNLFTMNLLLLITFAYSVVFWLQDQMAHKCSALNWVIHVAEKQCVCVCLCGHV